MERGNLIFYSVLFGAWLLTFLAKKLSTDKTPSERKGVTFRILEFIAKLNSEVEEQANKPQAAMGQQISTAPEKRGRTASKPAARLQRKHTTQKIETVSTREARIIHSPIINGTPVKVRKKFSRKKMQQAIIWSEIIQPPMALRE